MTEYLYTKEDVFNFIESNQYNHFTIENCRTEHSLFNIFKVQTGPSLLSNSNGEKTNQQNSAEA